eukprot:1220925-Rhodomonas_salina.3
MASVFLSQDIAFVVLRFVDVRSLALAGCVCKSWKEHVDFLSQLPQWITAYSNEPNLEDAIKTVFARCSAPSFRCCCVVLSTRSSCRCICSSAEFPENGQSKMTEAEREWLVKEGGWCSQACDQRRPNVAFLFVSDTYAKLDEDVIASEIAKLPPLHLGGCTGEQRISCLLGSGIELRGAGREGVARS